MATKATIITLATLILLALLLPSPCPNFDEATVVINQSQEISVAVARSSTAKARGLSGCGALKPGHGMYFSFPEGQIASFWMKDMLIPIDIIWIANQRVIGLEENVPTPQNNNLIIYQPPQPVDAVLEIAAGQAAQLGLTPGGTTKIVPEY